MPGEPDQIQRWACTGDQEMTAGYGEYVRYADHVAALEEERAATDLAVKTIQYGKEKCAELEAATEKQNAAWVARIEKKAKGHQGQAEQAGRKAAYKDSQLWMTRKYEEEAASDALLDLLKEVDDGE